MKEISFWHQIHNTFKARPKLVVVFLLADLTWYFHRGMANNQAKRRPAGKKNREVLEFTREEVKAIVTMLDDVRKDNPDALTEAALETVNEKVLEAKRKGLPLSEEEEDEDEEQDTQPGDETKATPSAEPKDAKPTPNGQPTEDANDKGRRGSGNAKSKGNDKAPANPEPPAAKPTEGDGDGPTE